MLTVHTAHRTHTMYNVIMVVFVDAVLRYNLLPQNYKLFVAADLSEFR